MKTPTILLVDDEKPILKALERELSDLSDELSLKIMSFTNPRKALSYINSHSDDIAVVVSDQRMPELKGCEFIAQAKEINPRISPILLTAYTDTEDIIRTVRTGIFSFILKPWDSADLEREVKKAYIYHMHEADHREYSELLLGDMAGGKQTQERFLEPQFEKDDRFIFTSSYKPHLSCGGDYYDVIKIDDDNYIVAIGDVAGHGIRAAFITFILKTITNDSGFTKLLSGDCSLGCLMSFINNRIYQLLSSIQPLFISFCLCRLNLKEKKLTICNGGHMSPLIIRDNMLIELESQGTALGFSSDMSYTEKNFILRDRDRIVLFTDGLSELEGGLSRLKDVFLFYKSNPYFVSAVMEDLQRIQAHGKIKDDMTLISLVMKL